MRKRYFLGTAARFSKSERKMMRKGFGDEEDLKNLYEFLQKEYDGKQTIVTINGRSAIAAGLKYYLHDFLKYNDGEIIVNGFTCYAVYQGVKAGGFTPVFADINKKDLNFTIKSLEKVLSNKTRAVIVQNTFGNMIDIKPIEEFCKKHKLILIEDLAHCVGRKYKDGREAGKVGELTVFSFGKEKSIDTGNGGAVVFRDQKMPEVKHPEKAEDNREELLSRIYPTIGSIYRGLSYVKLSSLFMRVMLKTKLVVKSADAKIDYTNKTLSYFQAKVALEQLKKKDELGKQPLREFYLVDNREEVIRQLKKSGYYFDGFWYERPVSPERYYKDVNFPEKDCPVAVEVSKKVINFPSYYDAKELDKAKRIVWEYLEEKQ